jgi:hypothetical protein
MAYQDPITGQWYDDNGMPIEQSAQGQPGSYLPGYGGFGNATTDPYSGMAPQSPGQPWTDYQSGVAPQQAPGGTPTPPPGAANPTDDTTNKPAIPAPGTSSVAGPTNDPYLTLGPFTETFTRPNPRSLPDLPTPEVPTYKTPAPFQAPTADAMKLDDGYKFRVGQGINALQAWAAARGTLNDSGTADALIDYGQNAASQEYNNLWNRELQGYQTNVQTQNVDPFNFAMQSAQVRNAQANLGYSTQAAWNQHANDTDLDQAWKQFLNDEDQWRFNVNGAVNLAGM